NTPPYLWPARSASHLTEKENLPRAERKSHLTEKENLPRATSAPARSAKPFDRKKNIPRATGAQAILKKKPTLPQHHIKSL
ncbi:hypothetical protein, partial [Faecalibacterium prausnitzii]|uniref:hypothetical protein n=1 Tax=Faecalibacterium prausnitzii TaxID=853 RepID=UPI0022E68E60